jgi:hypothetical protein
MVCHARLHIIIVEHTGAVCYGCNRFVRDHISPFPAVKLICCAACIRPFDIVVKRVNPRHYRRGGSGGTEIDRYRRAWQSFQAASRLFDRNVIIVINAPFGGGILKGYGCGVSADDKGADIYVGSHFRAVQLSVNIIFH